MNQDLPTFVVLNATHSHPKANVQAISAQVMERRLSLRRSMPVSRFDRAAIRYFTSTTLMAFPRTSDAACLTDSLRSTNCRRQSWAIRKPVPGSRSMRWRFGCRHPCLT